MITYYLKYYTVCAHKIISPQFSLPMNECIKKKKLQAESMERKALWLWINFQITLLNKYLLHVRYNILENSYTFLDLIVTIAFWYKIWALVLKGS